MWWFLSLHLGFRARDESRKLLWGDVQLQQQNDGQEVLVWLAERGAKTRHGQERGHQRAFQPKIYATNTARCPVSFYKNSAVTGQWKWTHQNPHFTWRSGIIDDQMKKFGIWRHPSEKMKQESFCPLQRRMLAFTESDKKVTNHSATKTCISRLLDADVPENFVAQLSGHKSTQSLQSYKSASAKHQKRMSLTLSRADLSGSKDEALSSVHNQGFEVITRSTTDIAASLTTNTLIDQSSDPLLSSTSSVFTGANIGSISGCTFQMFHGNVKIVQNERKRRIVIENDEDDWLWSYFYQLCPVLN